MNVVVNGDRTDLPTGATVADVIAQLGHPGGAHGVAVALNGEVVQRGAWDATTLHPNDRVEVLAAAQGG
jgi:sulfur carrier protein